MNIPNNIEDIYPLTIISMRYKDRLIMFNCTTNMEFISDAVNSEEISYDIEEWLEIRVKKEYGINYGIGHTIWDTFQDYKQRLKDG